MFLLRFPYDSACMPIQGLYVELSRLGVAEEIAGRMPAGDRLARNDRKPRPEFLV